MRLWKMVKHGRLSHRVFYARAGRWSLICSYYEGGSAYGTVGYSAGYRRFDVGPWSFVFNAHGVVATQIVPRKFWFFAGRCEYGGSGW